MNIRKVAFRIIYAGLLLVATGILLEIGGRYLPVAGKATKPSNVSFVFDKDVGKWHRANSTGTWNSACYEIGDIHFNGFGMRDRERKIEKEKYRIAILGDSMIEALQVRDQEVVNRVMEKRLADRVEVLNFGMSGFGTVEELVAYRTKVAPFHPDVVVVAFLPKNDVRDNSMPLRSRALEGWGDEPPENVPFFGLNRQGELVQIYWPREDRYADKAKKSATPKRGLLSRSRAYQLCQHFYTEVLWPGWQRLRWWAGSGNRIPSLDRSEDWHLGVYMEPQGEWAPAWEITEKTLLLFKKEVEQQGAKLVVITLPTDFELDVNPEKEYFVRTGYRFPSGFDVTYPHRRLAAFCKQNGILFKSMYEPFMRYRNEHGMTHKPYMGRWCDGHYSPLGHRLLAENLSSYLSDQGIFSTEAQIPRP